MSDIDGALMELETKLPGWKWTLYGPSETHGPRCVLVHPEHRIQLGRSAKTPEAAIRQAVDDVMVGKRS